MQNSDLLLTTAEVGAAFAGFTAIVSALRQDASVDQAHRWRIRGMIENSLLVVCFSLFPFTLSGFFEPETVWRWSSGALALCWMLGFALALRRALRITRESREYAPIFTASAAVIMTLGVAALILNTLGQSFGSASTMYFIGLFAPILVAAVLFVRIVVLLDAE